MNYFANLETLNLFILITFPGITAILFYSLLNPRNVDWSLIPLEAAFYGFLNFILFKKLLLIEQNSITPIIYFFVSPCVLTYLFYRIRKIKKIQNFIIEPSSSPWDFFFEKREECYVIATLKDGSKVGGYFGGSSCAGCYPLAGEIYIQYSYDIDENGNIKKPYTGTKGIMIAKGEYKHLEFFNVPEETPKED